MKTIKNKSLSRLITIVIVLSFFCQNILLADTYSLPNGKLAARSRWIAYWNDPEHQLDETCMDAFIYATRKIEKEIEEYLKDGNIGDPGFHERLFSAIDKVNEQLQEYGARSGYTMSITRPERGVPTVQLLKKHKRKKAGGNIVDVPYLVFNFGRENPKKRVVVFNLEPDKLSIEAQREIGIKNKRDLGWLKIPGTERVWVMGDSEISNRLLKSTMPISMEKFVEQYQGTTDPDSLLNLLLNYYHMDDIDIKVKVDEGILGMRGVGGTRKTGPKQYEIALIGVEGGYLQYLLFHEFLHIYLEERGLTFNWRTSNERISSYLFNLKNLINDYLIEKENQRMFGNSYVYVTRETRDRDVRGQFMGLGTEDNVEILLLALTCKIVTSIYPELSDSFSAQLIGDRGITIRVLDKIMEALQALSMMSPSSDYTHAVSYIHFLLTGDTPTFDGDTIVVDSRQVLKFCRQIDDLIGQIKAALGGAMGFGGARDRNPHNDSEQRLMANAREISEPFGGQAIYNYLDIRGIERYRYLSTKDISIQDLPLGYPVSLRKPPLRTIHERDLQHINVRMPEVDILLVSHFRNGARGVVRLGFLDDGRPVAVKTYYTYSKDSDNRLIHYDYKDVVFADILGIGPRVHGMFVDETGREGIVMDIVPGDFPEAVRYFITPETIKDFREINMRLLKRGKSIAFDIQYFVTPEGRIQILDPEGISDAPQGFDEYNAIFINRLVYLLSLADKGVQIQSLKEMIEEGHSLLLEYLKDEIDSPGGLGFRDRADPEALAVLKGNIDEVKGKLVKKGTPATLLQYMYSNGIFSNSPKKSKELARQRGGNDSLRTIQKELKVLKAVGLVEGSPKTGYYLPDWLRDVNIEDIITENPELNLPNPNEEQITRVRERVKMYVRERGFLDLLQIPDVKDLIRKVQDDSGYPTYIVSDSLLTILSLGDKGTNGLAVPPKRRDIHLKWWKVQELLKIAESMNIIQGASMLCRLIEEGNVIFLKASSVFRDIKSLDLDDEQRIRHEKRALNKAKTTLWHERVYLEIERLESGNPEVMSRILHGVISSEDRYLSGIRQWANLMHRGISEETFAVEVLCHLLPELSSPKRADIVIERIFSPDLREAVKTLWVNARPNKKQVEEARNLAEELLRYKDILNYFDRVNQRFEEYSANPIEDKDKRFLIASKEAIQTSVDSLKDTPACKNAARAAKLTEGYLTKLTTAWLEGISDMSLPIVPSEFLFYDTTFSPLNISTARFDKDKAIEFINGKLRDFFGDDSPLITPEQIVIVKYVYGVKMEGVSAKAFSLVGRSVIEEKVLSRRESLEWILIHEALHILFPGFVEQYLDESVTEWLTGLILGRQSFGQYSDSVSALKQLIDETNIREHLIDAYKTGDVSKLRKAIGDDSFLILNNLSLFEFTGAIRSNLRSPDVFKILKKKLEIQRRINFLKLDKYNKKEIDEEQYKTLSTQLDRLNMAIEELLSIRFFRHGQIRLSDLSTDLTGIIEKSLTTAIPEDSPLPFDIKEGDVWLPPHLQEQRIEPETLDINIYRIIDIIQSELARHGFPYSVFLIGSSVIGKEDADIDIMISEKIHDRHRLDLANLRDSLRDRLQKELSLSEIQTRDVLILFRDEMQVLENTIHNYGRVFRIKYNSVFQISSKMERIPNGSPATLLRYMSSNKVFSDNPKRSKELARQRGGNDSRRTIQRELRVLQDVGLVQGDKAGYCLADWLRDVKTEDIIRENPELNYPNPSDEEIRAVAERVRKLARFTLIKGVEIKEYISLADNRVPEPLPRETYRISESHCGIARYSKDRSYMITCGLSSCAAVVFYSPKIKGGLISHIVLAPPVINGQKRLEMDKYVLFLVNEFLHKGGSLDDLEITLVWGPSRSEYEIHRMAELVSSLKKIKYEKFRFDSTEGTSVRGVCLNLEDGNVEEIDKGTGWSWSEEHDTSINVRNQELIDNNSFGEDFIERLKGIAGENGLDIDSETVFSLYISTNLKGSQTSGLFNHSYKTIGVNVVHIPYEPRDIQELEQIIRIMRESDRIIGANIGGPFEESIKHLLDDVEDLSKGVNVVYKMGGRLYGRSNEGEAWARWYQREVGQLEGKTVMVIGTGKAGTEICEWLIQGGISTIYLADIRHDVAIQVMEALKGRFPDKDIQVLEMESGEFYEKMGNSNIVINATGIGKEPRPDESPIKSFESIRPGMQVVDLNYRPPVNLFLRECATRGAKTFNGSGFLASVNAMHGQFILQGLTDKESGDIYEQLYAANMRFVKTQQAIATDIDLFNTFIIEDKVYEIRYDASRLSESQQGIIETYIRLIKGRVANPDNIAAIPFKDIKRDYIIKVTCKNGDRQTIGEGQVNVDIEDEVGGYPLRIIGMLNIAFAAANVPDKLTSNQLEEYRPLISFIQNQYKSITGGELTLSDSVEEMLKAIRKIELPKPEKIELDEANRLNRIARQLLTSA